MRLIDADAQWFIAAMFGNAEPLGLGDGYVIE